MRSSKRLMAVCGAMALAGCQVRTMDGATNGFDTQLAFERLKTMAGTYDVEFPDVTDHSKVIWDNVSGGHAIVETLNVGTPDEMVSLYYLDGEDLAMTHYCGIGNRPLMRLDRARSTRDEYFFEFDRATTGIDPATDAHIHAAHFKFLAADAVDVEWSFWDKGAEQHQKLFELRKQPGKFTAGG